MATRSKSPRNAPPDLAEALGSMLGSVQAAGAHKGGIPMFGKLIIVAALTVGAYLIPETRPLSGWILFFGVVIAFVIEGVRIAPQQCPYVVDRFAPLHEVIDPALHLTIPV